MRNLILVLLCPLWCFSQVSQYISIDTLMMGSAFTFTAVHDDEDEDIANQAILQALAEVHRIEQLISSWIPASQTSQINKFAGIKPVQVDYELYELIERSLKISKLTNGYFDISFASIDKIWQFYGQEASMPSQQELEASVALINYQDIVLEAGDTSVFLRKENMKIGFGAIGKGYAADRAKEIMLKNKVQNGVVNAGGDLLAWGFKAENTPWSIGIANPNDQNEIFTSISLTNQALVTSGDYEKFVIIDGLRYGHIINPKTGMPVKGIASVSILAPSAELADGLATAVFVLGKDDGLALVNHLNGVECILVTDENKILYSKNIKPKELDEKTD